SRAANVWQERAKGSAEPGNLFLGHDTLDILGLALDAVARAAVGLDRQARDDRVDASFLHRGAALRALLLVMDVVIDRVVMGHRRLSGEKRLLVSTLSQGNRSFALL